MIIQLSFNHSFKIVKIDKHTNKDATSASTLGTVMVALYCKSEFQRKESIEGNSAYNYKR